MSCALDGLRASVSDPARVLIDLTVEPHQLAELPVQRVSLRFRAKDLRGDPYEARGDLLVPVDVLSGKAEAAPVWFNCGYEISDSAAVRQLRRGRIVVTPRDPVDGEVFPHGNPLCRGPNTDLVLAHLVRGLPLVDPRRIVYAGGSAGGYAALLVAAEAFPAAAAVVTAPPVNLAYQAAYMMRNAPRLAAEPPPDEPLVAVLMGMFLPFIDAWLRGYGPDLSDPAWLQHSPVAQVERITCPVSAFFSTADFLVPIEQVAASVGTAKAADVPQPLTVASDALSTAPAVRLRLLDVLGDEAEVVVVRVPDGAALASIRDVDLTMTRPQAPVPVPRGSTGRWQVVVVDEGPTVFGIGHTRHLIEPDFEAYVQDALDAEPQLRQLTPAKLNQLLARWQGREWLADAFAHLDEPAAERADVARGLRSYVSTSPAHAQRFAALYAALDADKQVLPDPLVDELLRRDSPHLRELP